MSIQNNKVRITGDGNIVIQNANESEITINTKNANDILSKFQELSSAQLDALTQIIEKEHQKTGEVVRMLLKGVVTQKNIVTGNHISNIRDLKVGDEVHYHYTIHIHRDESIILYPFFYKKISGIWRNANSILKAIIKETNYVLKDDFPILKEIEEMFNLINPVLSCLGGRGILSHAMNFYHL